MIRIAIVGEIGSGKTYISYLFGLPVFNADKEVSKIYKNNKNFFLKLKKFDLFLFLFLIRLKIHFFFY